MAVQHRGYIFKPTLATVKAIHIVVLQNQNSLCCHCILRFLICISVLLDLIGGLSLQSTQGRPPHRTAHGVWVSNFHPFQKTKTQKLCKMTSIAKKVIIPDTFYVFTCWQAPFNQNCLTLKILFFYLLFFFSCPQGPGTSSSAKSRNLPSTQITPRKRRGHASAGHPKPGQSVRVTQVSIALPADSIFAPEPYPPRLCSHREDRDHFRRKAAAYPPIRERSPLRREVARSPHSRSGSSVSSRGYSPDRAKGLPFQSTQQGKSMWSVDVDTPLMQSRTQPDAVSTSTRI